MLLLFDQTELTPLANRWRQHIFSDISSQFYLEFISGMDGMCMCMWFVAAQGC